MSVVWNHSCVVFRGSHDGCVGKNSRFKKAGIMQKTAIKPCMADLPIQRHVSAPHRFADAAERNQLS